MDYMSEYRRWLENIRDEELNNNLLQMNDAIIEDSFYRNLSFGTGGLRGVIGLGTNRMNEYVVARASQGLANYIGQGKSVVIGYDSRIKSNEFARVAAQVFAANGIHVYIWSELLPVPTVSFAVRKYGAKAGVMITASHNPAKYNGYKVYGSDGCQITTEDADKILIEIDKLDIFNDIKIGDFEEFVNQGLINYIDEHIFDEYISAVKEQSVNWFEACD